MDKNNKNRFEITELFMAKADKDRCFTGIIKRFKDAEGNPFVFSRIVMPNGLLCAKETEQKALGKQLDIMAKDFVDGNLHDDFGVSTEIFGSQYFLN